MSHMLLLFCFLVVTIFLKLSFLYLRTWLRQSNTTKYFLFNYHKLFPMFVTCSRLQSLEFFLLAYCFLVREKYCYKICVCGCVLDVGSSLVRIGLPHLRRLWISYFLENWVSWSSQTKKKTILDLISRKIKNEKM